MRGLCRLQPESRCWLIRLRCAAGGLAGRGIDFFSGCRSFDCACFFVDGLAKTGGLFAGGDAVWFRWQKRALICSEFCGCCDLLTWLA